MIQITITADNIEQVHAILDRLSDKPPIITTDVVSANEMFEQMYKWFEERKKKE